LTLVSRYSPPPLSIYDLIQYHCTNEWDSIM
jgi:hypothetical protein